MKLTEMHFDGVQPVDAYGPGFFRVQGEKLEGAMLITATGVRAWGGVDDEATLLALAGEVDVILVGTGSEIAHLPPKLRNRVEAAGMGAEVMNTPAACRTYNVLVAEGRRVALAALPV